MMVSRFPYKIQIKPIFQGLSRQNFNEGVKVQFISWRHKRNGLKIKMSAMGSTELPIGIQVDMG